VTAAEKRWQVHVAGWARAACRARSTRLRSACTPGRWRRGSRSWGAPRTAAPTFVEVTEQLAITAEPDAGELELVVGRTLLRVRGRVEAEALTRVLDVLEARA
jgi:hypothetical protein